MITDYQKQATDFLERFGLEFSFKRLPNKPAPWESGSNPDFSQNWELTIKGSDRAFSFPWWRHNSNKNPVTAYDCLTTLASDAHCDDDFDEWCGEYGYDTDSRKALATWERCLKFSGEIQAFFTDEELEALQEIQ